jgi:alpha-amylase
MRLSYFIIIIFLLVSCSEKKSNSESMSGGNFNRVDWIQQSNIYEVNLRQYTDEGTFSAFEKELTRLKAMGVEVLWFMPITPISQKNKKGEMGSYYACSDYVSINPEFGNLEDFKNLVKKAHEMGFKVIIDWVANHTGWDHVWTKSNPEWYEKDSTTNDFKIASGMDDIIELDFSNKDMRKAMVDAMAYWVRECDIDGFRADLAFWVELDFWKEARTAIEEIKPLFWLGELDPLDHPEYMEVFDAAYTWTWMHKARDFYQQKLSIDVLDSVLKKYENIPPKGSIMSWFTTNHDENSWNGTEYEKYGQMAKALAVFSCTWPGIPLIYSGQELPNKKRLEFFKKDVIKWSWKYELEDFYKTLFNLRSKNPALRANDENAKTFRINTSENTKLFSFLRVNGDREVFVLLNLSDTDIMVEINDEQIKGSFKNSFTGEYQDFSVNGKSELKAWDYKIFEK